MGGGFLQVVDKLAPFFAGNRGNAGRGSAVCVSGLFSVRGWLGGVSFGR